jgi:phospholipid-binding lipoprotein MlaA
MNLPAKGFPRLAALLCTGLLLGGCATTGPRNPTDPFEHVNRDAYRMNDTIDRVALKPVAIAYHDHTPTWVQAGVGHFFSNLGYPWTIMNQLLQGKIKAAGQDTARFVINSTLGWAGIFDVASGANLPEHEEDLGQTLGRWGVPAGPYLMLPLLGPATVRDLPSAVGERFVTPLYWFNVGNAKWGSLAVSAIDKRARLLTVDPTLDRVFDKYSFIRDAYLQRRQYQLYDGNPPEEPLDPELQQEMDEANREEPPGK